MLLVEIGFVLVMFVALGFLHFYLYNKEKVDIAEMMLEVSLGWFIKGDLNEKEYQAQRLKIFDGLTKRQRKMYNKRHGIDMEEVKFDEL